MKEQNPMREIRIEKVTLNMGAGADSNLLDKFQKIMETISGKKPIITSTKGRTTFGMAPKRPIGCKITLRGEEAENLLKKLLQAVDNTLKPTQFDRTGNFSFGIKEYINIPGIKYDPDVGIVGLDVIVTLERRGYRVKKRARNSSKVGKNHVIKPEEAIEFAKKQLGIKMKLKDEEED